MSTYTAWPLQTDVEAKLAMGGITPRSTIDSAYYTAIIDAVAAGLQQKTKRQFLPGSAGEVRYYDGSGTGTQVVDEYITFTDITILGYAGYTGINFANCVESVTNLYPRTEILIARGGLPAIGRVWLTLFPEGRRNIQVTGTWGYAQYIPADVWEAVRAEAAAWIAAETVYHQKGRIKKWMELDTLEDRDITLPGEAMGWHRLFKQVCADRRKPLQANLNQARRRMI